MFDDFMEELRRRQADQRRAGAEQPPDDGVREERAVTADDSDRDDNGHGPQPLSGGGWGGRTRRSGFGPSGQMPQMTIGRRWIVLAALLFFVLPVVLGVFAVGIGLWTDSIWFDSVGYSSVFWTRLTSQVAFFVIGVLVAFAVLWLNVWLAGRFIPKGQARRFSLDDFMERFNVDRFASGSFEPRHVTSAGETVEIPNLDRPIFWALIVFGALVALGLGGLITGGWNTIQLYMHRVPFGTSDPVFNKDIGFYLFELPLFRLIQSYINTLLLMSIALAGIRYLIAVVMGASMSTAARVHLGVLAMLYLWSVAIGYQLDKLELVYGNHGTIFTGVSAADASARFLAFDTLTIVAAFAGCFLLGFAYTRWRIPLGLTVAVWLGAYVALGWVYPMAVQGLVVNPNGQNQEALYIHNNIEMTQLAFGLESWTGPQYTPKATVTKSEVESESGTIQNVRLWDYRPLGQTLDQLQVIRQYYSFGDVDTDRYVFTDAASCAPAAAPCVRQIMIAGRQFDPQKYSDAKNGDVSWVNAHITFTHGVGVVVVPVNEVVPGGQPMLMVKDLPPVSSGGAPTVTEPRIYFGDQSSDYVIVNAVGDEFDYPSSTTTGGDAYNRWTGKTGIKLDTTFTKLLFSLRFGDLNMLISDQISGDSQLLYNRSIRDRCQAIAPFLRYDKDPYLVISGGRLFYIQDAYTTSAAFPGADYYNPGSDSGTNGLAGDQFNYVRNSVKVVMDAYDGTMTFYVADPNDPIIQAWQGVFPGLFHPLSEIPSDLRAHLRYPEDMFNAQTTEFERYHVTDSGVFFQGNDVWQVPQNADITATNNGAEQLPLEAYYVQMRVPGKTDPEFVLLQPMVPQDRKNMIAWVAAHNDPASYGQVSVFTFPRSSNVFGPAQIQGLIAQNRDISQQITLWGQVGSKVILGNLLVIPLQDSLLYIEPVYLKSTDNPMPVFQKVIVGTPTQIVWGDSLQDALNQIYAGAGTTTPGGSPSPGTSPSPSASPGGSPTPGTSIPANADAQQLIALANQHYEAAQQALRNGDLGTYQKEMEIVGQILDQLQTLLGTPAP
jgi:uncharacterized membrane protein (UPF0182 family)